MKQRLTKLTPQSEPVESRISVRLEQPIAERFARVVTASKRTKTSILEECLEEVLPKLEKQYAKAA